MPRVARWSTDRAVEADDDQLVTAPVRGGEGRSNSPAAAGVVEVNGGRVDSGAGKGVRLVVGGSLVRPSCASLRSERISYINTEEVEQ